MPLVLSHEFSAALALGDQQMMAMVSDLREAQESLFKQAEVDMRRHASQQRLRLRDCFEKAVKAHSEATLRAASMNSVLGIVEATDKVAFTNASSRSFHSSNVSSSLASPRPERAGKLLKPLPKTDQSTSSSNLSQTATEKREWFRRGYAGIGRSSFKRNVAKETLIRPLLHACGTKRLNCIRVSTFVNSRHFVAWVCLMIFANAAFIGVSSDAMVKDSYDAFEGGNNSNTTSRLIATVEICFNVAFIIELLLRVIALEGGFFVGPEWTWNIFDSVLVLFSLVEMYLYATDVNFSFIRVLRLFRIVRTLRMVRLLRFAGAFKNLRLMILAIIKSSGPLVFATGILITLMFLFAVLVLSAVTSYVETAVYPDQHADQMHDFFSSMPMTLLTLFMCITGGVNWWEVQKLLLKVHVGYGIMFVVYIAVMFLAVLNIITGIFVNDAVEMANTDHDMMLQVEQELKLDQLKKLKHLFVRFDTNGDKLLTLVELEDQLLDPEVQVILAMLGLDISEAKMFFNALDVDKSGTVEIDEFVMGCMNLKGKTKLMDIEVTVNETKRLVKKMFDKQKEFQQHLRTLPAETTVDL